MADFDPALHTSQDFDPSLHTVAAPEKPRGLGGMVVAGAKGGAAELARGASILAGKVLPPAAGWLNQNVTAPLGEYAQGQAPKEGAESSTANQVAYGIGGFLPTLAAAALVPEVEVPAALAKAAPFVTHAVQGMAKMAIPASLSGVSRGQDLLDQGVDSDTATKAAAISALTGTAMGAVPMGLQGGLVKRAATGAISNIAMGEAGRQAQNAVLSDYPDQQSHLTGQGVAVNAITGALLGTILGPRPEKTAIAKATADAQADVTAGEPLQIGNSPTPMVAYPDGTISRGHAETEAFISKLPEDQQIAARAKIYGYGEQTGAIEEAQAADVSRRLAEYAKTENAPFVETIPARSQAHVADMATLRDASEVPTGDPRLDGVRAYELQNGSVGGLVRMDGSDGVVPDTGMNIVHGSGNAAMKLDDVEIVRAKGQKQGKAGRVYGGLYGSHEADISHAEGYASMMGGEASLYNVAVKPGTKILNKTGNITRLSEAYINELRGDGYGLVVGKDPRGRTEYVIIDKEAIQSFGKRVEKPVPSENPVSERSNTQLADALAEAQRLKAIEDGKAGTAAGFDQAVQDAAAAKAREEDAIQRIAHGDKVTEAVARGETPPGPTLPASHNLFLDTLTEVLPQEQKLPAKLKQELTQAVRGKDSLEAQIDAIKALQEGKRPSTVGYDLLGMLHDKLTEGRTIPDEIKPAETPETVQAEAQGPEKTAAPASAGAEPGAPAETPAEVAPLTGKEHLQEAADRLTTTLADFTGRVRAGENLSESEQARFKSAQEFAGAIERTKNPNKRPEMDEYLHELATMADDHTTPEGFANHQQLMSREPSSIAKVEAHRPDLAAVIASGSTHDVLAHLQEHGSSQEVKDTAKLLDSLGLTTKIQVGGMSGENGRAVGEYDPATDQAFIGPTKVSESTVIHEIVHGATEKRVAQAQAIEIPKNQAEAKLKAAYVELEAVRKKAQQNVNPVERLGSLLLKGDGNGSQYGLTDAHEFLAELRANPAFREFLQSKSLWTRTVDAIRKLLGLPVESKSLLDRALAVEGDFIGKAQYEEAKQFNSSPKGAAEVTDNVLSRIARSADEDKTFDFGRANLALFQKSLGWKTVQFMADRVRALPEMVQSGFSRHVDAYETAYKTRELANHYAENTAAKFAGGVQKMLHGLGDAVQARELNRQMSEIGVGSSIGGFEPNKNFDENLKLRPDLSPTNKAYIDGIYRQFKALEKSNPVAAKAIIEGAQVNRKGYVLDAATVIRNLMQHAIATNSLDAAMSAQHVAGLDMMGKDVQTAINRNTTQHIDGASYALDQRIKAAFTAAKALPKESMLRAQLGEIEGKYLNQIDNPYYHAGRSGEYFAKIGFQNMDAATWDKMKAALVGTNKVLGDFTNQDHAFFRVDTADQAIGLRRKLEAAAGDKLLMGESAHGLLAQAGQISNTAGISAALRSVLATLHETVDLNPAMQGEQAAAMKDAMTRKFLSMLPESSTRLATIKRMGVPGYDGDFLGTFSKRAAGGVQDTANIYAMPLYTSAFKGMKESIEQMSRGANIDMQSRAQMVSDEITKRYTDAMKPLDTSHINLINSLGHSFYLALAPAFFIRTMAQPFHRGLPILGSRYGFVSSAKEIGAATGTAMKIIGATIKQGWDEAGARGVLDAEMKFKDMGLTEREEAFVQELHDRGVLNLGQSRQLQRMAIGGSQKAQDLARFTSMTAQYAEMTNRLSTGLAAFRLAEKGSKNAGQKGTAANTEYAIKAIDYAMDNFDPNNTARQIGKHGFIGKATPLVTAFMNYNLQTMQQIARTVHDGMFNQDQSSAGLQRAKEARKEFAGLMGTTAMISGAMGLPFINAFAGVYNMLTKSDDDPGDIRQDARNFLSDTFGETGGNLLAHGIGHAVGVDTSTFGLENLLPGSEFLASRRLMKDRLAETSQGLMGPALNAGMDIMQALSKMSDGYYVKGIEQALPAGLKGYWKAGEMATRGYTDAKGNPIGLGATPWDIAVQATGLRPADRAVQAEAANYFDTNQQLLNHRKGVISDDIFKAVTQGGDGPAAFGAMNDFNTKNPMQPITNVAGMIRQHEIELAIAKASGTGVGANAKKLPILQQQLRFVNNGAMPQY